MEEQAPVCTHAPCVRGARPGNRKSAHLYWESARLTWDDARDRSEPKPARSASQPLKPDSDGLSLQVRETQALILAPTRELAVQIQKVRRLRPRGAGFSVPRARPEPWGSATDRHVLRDLLVCARRSRFLAGLLRSRGSRRP